MSTLVGAAVLSLVMAVRGLPPSLAKAATGDTGLNDPLTMLRWDG